MPALGEDAAGARHARRGGAGEDRRPAPRRRPAATRTPPPVAAAAPEGAAPEAEPVKVEGGAERKAAALDGRAVTE
jgi:hypothetical protein